MVQRHGAIPRLVPTECSRGAVKLLVIGALVCSACGISEERTLPPDVRDPATLKTPSGALGRYRGAIAALASVVTGAATIGGILTDELAALPTALGTGGQYTNLDSRRGPSGLLEKLYARLHFLRGQAREARGFLVAFASDSSPALRGHLFALEGYAEIFLADLFCSGIPLSTVDFDGDYTLVAGSSTEDVYRNAVRLFDSATTLSSDSVRVQQLAAIGRGRALLALGQYADAAAAVAGVPDDYNYQSVFPYSFLANSSSAAPDSVTLWWYATRVSSATGTSPFLVAAPSMANQEGGTGLNYRSSGDPRTTFAAKGRDPLANSFFFPRKYTSSPITTTNPALSNPIPFTVANGVEARLIEAEAALQAGDVATWLTKLNQPRQSLAACGTIVPATTCPLSTLEDPGVALTDPVAAKDARLDLLFRERAFWLYLTAHRQGDLRRLIRQYFRNEAMVYPTGNYPGGPGSYGQEVVVPVPDEEEELNPKYTGCNHHNA